MKYPEFLKDKGTIGFVAPSFGAGFEPYISCLDNAVKKFKDMGYYVNLGPNCYASKGIGISNTPEACADELVSSYVNPDIDVLLAVGGGELMCETMSAVDLDALENAGAKWYMGYSDNTNLTFLLATRFDIASIYGPCGGSFGMEPWHKCMQDAWDVITGKKLSVSNYDLYETESLKTEENPLATINATEPVCIKAFVPCKEGDCAGAEDLPEILTRGVMLTDGVEMEGRIIGGCLDILDLVVGTRFDYVNQFLGKYREDGFIWYLEACDLSVFEIRRALWTMQEAGWLRHVKGFIFGRPANGEQMMNLNHFDAVLPTACVKNRCPVIMDADIGHVAPSMPIINGAYAKVKFNAGRLNIDFELK